MRKVRPWLARAARDAARDRHDTTPPHPRPATEHPRSRPLAALLACCSLAALVSLIGAGAASAQAGSVLLFHGTTGTPHGANEEAIAAIEQLGADNDFTVDTSADAADFTAANLAGYRAVVFLNTNGNVLNAAQENAFQAYVADGGGFVGIHDAANAEPGSAWFDDLIGARPEGAESAATERVVEVGDRVHLATEHLPLEWTRTDGWFEWTDDPTGDVHTLATLRNGDYAGAGQAISWCRDYDGGRSFYTGMGHTAASYADADFTDHLLGGIQWAAGMVRSGCKATIESNYTATRLTEPNTPGTLDQVGEPHGLVVAPDGRVIYIGRAAGRPIVNDWDDPDHGLGAGTVHVWDPATGDVTLAATLDVFGNRGNGPEKVKTEEGTLGLTLDPSFASNNRVYVYWTPHSELNRTDHTGMRRISRFTLNPDTNQLELASEVVILEWLTQMDRCCHAGGGMAFDSAGNLHVTTGDNNSSQCQLDAASETNCDVSGYSGNVAAPEFMGLSQQDARRTAGNTNDLNGKMIRINPIEAATPATEPGVGTTYEIPEGNLFDESADTNDQTRPEIYAMGLRNPARMSIDTQTDWAYTGWVGPDAGEQHPVWGPAKYDQFAVIEHASNRGWPYCMGNNLNGKPQPYRDRDTTDMNQPLDWYDCANLQNTSPRNTGLTDIPPAEPNNLWYAPEEGGGGCPIYAEDADGIPIYDPDAPGYERTEACPWMAGGGQAAMNGPVYRVADNDPDAASPWPSYWDGKWFVGDFYNGANPRHAVTMDPATAPEGALPVHVDSLKQIVPGEISNLMDWKFGPDGTLYVLNYGSGFFSIANNSALWKVEYTGGPDTPAPDPQRLPSTDDPLAVPFSIGASGGVSYEWDFGDGETSTETDPTHTYAEAGEYTVTLTVTYADGEEATGTLDINVVADEAPPTTTAALDPADPGPGGTYNVPVTVTLTADDREDGSGVASTEYRVDGGEFAPYTEPFEVSELGAHTVEFRSTDFAGNAEEAQSVEFTIEEAGGGTCLPQTDEFDGDALDPKWDVLRPNPDALSVADGSLNLTISEGDMIGDTATAQNVVLQDAASGDWTAATKLNRTELTNEGEQAGLLVWAGEDPNTFVKILFINKGSGTLWFEYVLTQDDGVVSLPNSGPLTDLPDDVYIRARMVDGTLFAEYSLDGGTWSQIGDPIADLGADLRVGLKASDTADSENAARFDWFRVLAGGDPAQPPTCGEGDLTPPTTEHTLDPAEPNGENGWYTSPVEVALEATDNEGGSGVESTEYRIDDGEFAPYGEPFTVSGDGEHTVEYRSTDADGNVEAPKSVDMMIDATAPTTTATTAGEDPVEVTLAADDGAGSGVTGTEFRVDGGEWQQYLSEQTILDSEADLGAWAQAGPGGLVWQNAEGGFARTSGGLGMPWYPVREYGDFSLKLQWRDSSEGENGNSGVFVRFPDPRIPLAERPETGPGDWDGEYCGRTGAAADDPAWVAIYCGQEIQINDHQGDVQKTGSIYNFSLVGEEDAQIQPKGTWVDYEVRVVGQQYTVLRNGEVLNEFDNSIPLDSSREGDPPTQARQFSSGYIGLQNHGTADVIDFRNVRVEPLSGGVAGPIVVSGAGEHTVEFRSTDGAGNVEQAKSVTFTIGAPGPGPGPGPGGPPEEASIDKPSKKESKLAHFLRRGIEVSATCEPQSEGSMRMTVKRNKARKLGLGKAKTLARSAVRCGSDGTLTTLLEPKGKAKRALKAFLRDGGGSVPTTLKLALSGPEGSSTDRQKLVLKGKKGGR